MAQHDDLTGLATRLVLEDRLNMALERANRQGTGLALLMLDLDRFKEINDTYGHQVGDEVLRVTSNRIQAAVRKSDTVARMGGDEFVALLPDLSDPHLAESLAAKIVTALSAPIPFAGRDLTVSVSAGVCTALSGDLDADTLLRNTDIAMYEAKAKGRNRFETFKPEMVHAHKN
jgi:diguanylate cyclase (GGDEF)-like protein